MTIPDNSWTLRRQGPLIIFETTDGEFIATLQCCWNQAGESTAVITTWAIDGCCAAQTLQGDHDSWSTYWSAFVDTLPTDLQPDVCHAENTVR